MKKGTASKQKRSTKLKNTNVAPEERIVVGNLPIDGMHLHIDIDEQQNETTTDTDNNTEASSYPLDRQYTQNPALQEAQDIQESATEESSKETTTFEDGANKEPLTLDEMSELYQDAKKYEGAPFTHEELRAALYWIQDVYERASIVMVLAYDTAESVKNEQRLSGSGIYVAIRKNEWNSGARGIVEAYAQYEDMTDDLITYRANNDVPVYVSVLDDHYCITSPDTILYEHEYFKLPNTIEAFLKEYPHV